MEFLKKFGIGILYALGFPLLLVLIALVAVYGVLVFLVEFVIMTINFFSGKKCFPVFPEDEEATKRKQEAIAGASPKQDTPPTPNNIYVQQVYYNADPTKMMGGFPPQGNPSLSQQQPPLPGQGNPFLNIPQQPVPPTPEQLPPIDADSSEPKEEKDHD